jgi:hypothetical protein
MDLEGIEATYLATFTAWIEAGSDRNSMIVAELKNIIGDQLVNSYFGSRRPQHERLAEHMAWFDLLGLLED